MFVRIINLISLFFSLPQLIKWVQQLVLRTNFWAKEKITLKKCSTILKICLVLTKITRLERILFLKLFHLSSKNIMLPHQGNVIFVLFFLVTFLSQRYFPCIIFVKTNLFRYLRVSLSWCHQIVAGGAIMKITVIANNNLVK